MRKSSSFNLMGVRITRLAVSASESWGTRAATAPAAVFPSIGRVKIRGEAMRRRRSFLEDADERRRNPGLALSGIQELAVLDRGVRALFVILHQPEAPTDKRRQVLIARLFLFQEFLHLRF